MIPVKGRACVNHGSGFLDPGGELCKLRCACSMEICKVSSLLQPRGAFFQPLPQNTLPSTNPLALILTPPLGINTPTIL